MPEQFEHSICMPIAVSTLVERIERGHADEENRQASLLAEASAWFERVRQFRDAELELMVLREPSTPDQRFHRAYLTQVLAQGESLAIRVRLHGMPHNAAGLSLGAIEAELASLALTQAQWHSGMTQGRKEELLREFSGEQKPKA